MNPRFEFPGAFNHIRWGAGANRNLIYGGQAFDGVIETFVTGQSLNSFIGTGHSRMLAYSGHGGLLLENGAGAAAAVLTVLRPGGTAGLDVPNTAYGTRLEYNTSRFKRFGDAYERLRVDGENGRIYFGGGATTPPFYLGLLGAS